jgi:hypothetical protein
MSSDIVLLGCACITHHDYGQPVSLTYQRKRHHQDNSITGRRRPATLLLQSLYRPCLALLKSCTMPVVAHTTLRTTEFRQFPFRLLVLLLQPAAALPRTSAYTHASPRGFITAYPTRHECISSVHNIHNPSASIHTHVNTYILSGAHVCNWRYFFPCRKIVSTSTYVWARPAVTSDNLASYIQPSYLSPRGKASSTDFEARSSDKTLQSLNTSTVGFELGHQAWHANPPDGRQRGLTDDQGDD